MLNRIDRKWMVLGAFLSVLPLLVALYFIWPHRDVVWQNMLEGIEWTSVWLKKTHPVYYLLALAILPAFGFPLSIFYFAAGALPFHEAVLVIGIGVAANLSISYGLSRSLLRPLLVKILTRFNYTLPELSEDRAKRFTMIVRISGSPYIIQNTLLGLTQVPFRDYLFISMGVQYAFAICFALLGDSLFAGRLMPALTGLFLFIILIFALNYLRKRYAQRRNISDPYQI